MIELLSSNPNVMTPASSALMREVLSRIFSQMSSLSRDELLQLLNPLSSLAQYDSWVRPLTSNSTSSAISPTFIEETFSFVNSGLGLLCEYLAHDMVSGQPSLQSIKSKIRLSVTSASSANPQLTIPVTSEESHFSFPFSSVSVSDDDEEGE
jgi:hypothetical protein